MFSELQLLRFRQTDCSGYEPWRLPAPLPLLLYEVKMM